MLEKAKKAERLAINLDYALECRLPLLRKNVGDAQNQISLYVPDGFESRKAADQLEYNNYGWDSASFPNREDVQKNFDLLRQGLDYSFEVLAHYDWNFQLKRARPFGHLGNSSSCITPENLQEQAEELRYALIEKLKSGINDDTLQRDARKMLCRSSFGRNLLKFASDVGYKSYFVDLRLFHYYQDDMGKPWGPPAVCFLEKAIFIDAYGKQRSDEVALALFWAHELGHAMQFYGHLGAAQCQTREDVLEFKKVYDPILPYMEAHSIACEYIVAADLIADGVGEGRLRDALIHSYNSTMIDLLSADPAAFIEKTAMSPLLIHRWRLAGKDVSQPQVAQKFAASLRAPATVWYPKPRLTHLYSTRSARFPE